MPPIVPCNERIMLFGNVCILLSFLRVHMRPCLLSVSNLCKIWPTNSNDKRHERTNERTQQNKNKKIRIK